MTVKVKIRPLHKNDEAQWRVHWKGYLDFYKSEVNEHVTAKTFTRLLDPTHAHQNAFVAVQGDAVIGMVHYIFHAHNWREEDVCYLQDLYVDPTIRKSGAGTALIEAVYAAADANGTPSVYWMTQDFNTNARSLYEKVATLTPFVKYQR